MTQEPGFESHICKNCNHQFEGYICSVCAQKVKYYSATPKGLFLEWWSVRKEDVKHFWFTTKELIKNPGKVIDEYLDGKRRKYYNSTNYFLLVASIVTILTIQFRAGDPAQSAESVNAFYESLGFSMPKDNPGGALAFDFISTHYNIALMLTLPFLALGSFLTFKWFFRNNSRKVGEHFVMHLFCYGLLNFLLIPFLPFINPGNPESKAMLFTSITMILFYSWVYKTWYKLNWPKAVIASILGYLIYFITFFLAVIAITIVIVLVVIVVVLVMKMF